MPESTEEFSLELGAPDASGPPPQPINDTCFARTLTFFALKIFNRRWRSGRTAVIWNFAIKTGASTTLAEAHAMKFVAEHTTIPVPKVYCAFIHKKRGYIVMERIYGEDAAYDWMWRSEQSKAKILIQLKGMIEQLREIPPPPPSDAPYAVSNVIGGPILDLHPPGEVKPRGPFRTIDDFHKELRENNDLEEADSALIPEDLVELLEFHKQPFSKLVFTHGDLSSLNIMVDGDEVVGIVDWETAGWFPPYWEYVNAWHGNAHNPFWKEEVDKFLTPLPHELKMDVVRRRYFKAF